MQSDPSESSNQLPYTTNAQSDNTSQHGFRPVDLHASGSFHGQQSEPARSVSPVDASATSVRHDGALEARLRRLSVGRATPTKSHARRIAEYENAMSPVAPKPEVEGPGFKVIKKKGHRLDGPRLEQFPNGRINNQPPKHLY